jgi:lincosamide nucleotidyltransferase A/C/D/E
MMATEDVLQVLDCLGQADVEVWLDGGWGVDALVGRPTRDHEDLDLAMDREEVPRAVEALAGIGYEHDREATPGLPARAVLRGPGGRTVDLHPLRFDRAGNGWQQLSESGRAWGCYEAKHLSAKGAIDEHPVRCISAELQLRFRRGYEWTENDEHDIRLLTGHFDLPAPPPLTDEVGDAT